MKVSGKVTSVLPPMRSERKAELPTRIFEAELIEPPGNLHQISDNTDEVVESVSDVNSIRSKTERIGHNCVQSQTREAPTKPRPQDIVIGAS